MHICYIWVKKYKNFRNYGLNLSNDYTFNFDHTNLKLSYSDNTGLPEGFFGKNISGVTALLGVNGSGKTTALELICRCITEHYHFIGNYILIYKIDNNFYLSNNFKENISINFPFIPDDENSKLRELNTIYFSNVFDQNNLDFNDKVIDISINRKMNPRYSYKDSLDKKRGEIEKQIIFLQSGKAKEIKLDAPRRIEYKLYKNTTELIRKISTPKFGRNSSDIIDPKLVEYISENLRKIFISERREYNVREGIRYTSMLIRQQFIASIIRIKPESQKVISTIIEGLNSTSNSISILEALSKETSLSLGEHCLSEMISIIILQMEGWLEAFNYESEQSIRGGRHSFIVDINEDNLWHHTKLSHIFEMLIEMDASWHGISSGQKAYLNMFSSIWNCIEENKINNNTLICIDEGDLYLHPQWQVEFVERLTNCLPVISNGNVQIIFTTHSPLLVSDIPNKCVCVLNECGDQKNSDLKTFGANIYDIYKEVFGMGTTRTGNLSHKYIKRTFDILDKKSLDTSDYDFLIEAKKLIDNKLILQHINLKLSNHD
ncbi:ATP-binding protein [Vibrio fluvialis]|nr:ATP-binding protein [Vibrio fluvialis]MBY8189605.1 ATP-binding protein [Vibrio fluvialis]